MYTCSYCNEGGHSINKCKHPDIDILQEKIKKDAVIHYYCMLKYDFNFLLYSVKLLTIPELRIISYKNRLDNKLSYKSNKLELQKYLYFLVEYFSFENKESITIPYFDNNILWDYAIAINRLIHRKDVLSIYMDIVKISPRPFCYNIKLELVNHIEKNNMNNNYKCSICFESMIDSKICVMNCNHSFCSNCVKLYLISLYKHNIRHNLYEPNCPLCRTKISTILINDYDSCRYFISTFIEEFTPNYFNSINEDSTVKTHKYEDKFYYSETPENDDEMFGPYNTQIHVSRNIVVFSHFKQLILDNLSIILKMISIVQFWVLFIGSICITHHFVKHNIVSMHDSELE